MVIHAPVMILFNFDKKVDRAFKNVVFTNLKEIHSNDIFYSAITCYSRCRNTEKIQANQMMHIAIHVTLSISCTSITP